MRTSALPHVLNQEEHHEWHGKKPTMAVSNYNRAYASLSPYSRSMRQYKDTFNPYSGSSTAMERRLLSYTRQQVYIHWAQSYGRLMANILLQVLTILHMSLCGMRILDIYCSPMAEIQLQLRQ